jgi:hypothetical protein
MYARCLATVVPGWLPSADLLTTIVATSTGGAWINRDRLPRRRTDRSHSKTRCRIALAVDELRGT